MDQGKENFTPLPAVVSCVPDMYSHYMSNLWLGLKKFKIATKIISKKSPWNIKISGESHSHFFQHRLSDRGRPSEPS